MGRFVEGADRSQLTLLPDCLEDWVQQQDHRSRKSALTAEQAPHQDCTAFAARGVTVTTAARP